MKAKFIAIEKTINGSLMHWHLEPPFATEDDDGFTVFIEWVVTSLIPWEDEYEVLMFPSNGEGETVSHNEISKGSYRGTPSHTDAICMLGYTPEHASDCDVCEIPF